MAQTTEKYTMRNCKVEFSINGTVWTDVSGVGNSVTWDGGERATEKTHTFDGDFPLVTEGKKDALTVTIKAVYTETAGQATDMAQSAYDADTPLYARWSPRGGLSGQKQFTTAASVVKKPLYPGGEGGSAAALMSEIVLETPSIASATVA